MMNALRLERFTGFEHLALTEVPIPKPGPREALVRVEAVALSRSDLTVMIDRAGTPGAAITPGSSFSGLVVNDGRFPPGTGVVVDPHVACDECAACALGPVCLRPIVLGRHRHGGIADFAVVPSASLVPLPRTMTFTEGAAIAASGSIASKVLLQDGGVRTGERVLVTGATGSLGLTLIQVARAFGCEVVALVSRPDRADLAREAGADRAVALNVEGVLPRAADLGGEVDVLVHLATETSWLPGLLGALRPGGRVVLRRVRPGTRLDLDLSDVAAHGLHLAGSTGARRGGLATTVEKLAATSLPPVIDRVQPFAELPSAFHRLAARENRGALVIRNAS